MNPIYIGMIAMYLIINLLLTIMGVKNAIEVERNVNFLRKIAWEAQQDSSLRIVGFAVLMMFGGCFVLLWESMRE